MNWLSEAVPGHLSISTYRSRASKLGSAAARNELPLAALVAFSPAPALSKGTQLDHFPTLATSTVARSVPLGPAGVF